MKIYEVIQELNAATKKQFGADMSVLIARSPAFGNNDFCFIVNGRNRLHAALAIARTLENGKIEEDSAPNIRGGGREYYSVVTGH